MTSGELVLQKSSEKHPNCHKKEAKNSLATGGSLFMLSGFKQPTVLWSDILLWEFNWKTTFQPKALVTDVISYLLTSRFSVVAIVESLQLKSCFSLLLVELKKN